MFSGVALSKEGGVWSLVAEVLVIWGKRPRIFLRSIVLLWLAGLGFMEVF